MNEWGNLISGTSGQGHHDIPQIIYRSLYRLLKGSVLISLVFIYVLLSTPVFAYRLLITKLIAPHFTPKIGKPVTPLSNAYATDLLYQRPPRAVIVVDLILEGSLTLNEVIHQLTIQLLHASDNGKLRFPELRQYVERWLGFLFWKQDFEFSIQNHITTHKLEENCTEEEAERYATQLIEDQLNTPFPPKKSPWGVHFVENFKMAGRNNEKTTLLVFRFQHTMADGYAILYTLVEALGKTPLSNMPLQSNTSTKTFKNISPWFWLFKISKLALMLVKNIVLDNDYLMSILSRPKSPWFISDDKKLWKQLYTRSKLISIDKFKEIKNRLGVSFTGVFLSAVSAGVSKSLKCKERAENAKIGDVETTKCLPTFSTVPLPGHPKNYQNHHAGVVFDIPAQYDLNPVDRLMECEKFMAHAKQSFLLPLAVAIWKLLGCQLAFMNAKIFQNPIIPAFLTNFPGPSFQLEFQGKKVLSASLAVGAGSGVAGIGFMVFSYNNTVRIMLTAENATMTRQELEYMLTSILEEIETLYEISVRSPSIQPCLN